jgi:hypothetical protein
VVAGLLRVSSCSTVPGGAKCNGRHAELVNKIKGPRFNTRTTNQEVGSSNLSGPPVNHASDRAEYSTLRHVSHGTPHMFDVTLR